MSNKQELQCVLRNHVLDLALAIQLPSIFLQTRLFTGKYLHAPQLKVGSYSSVDTNIFCHSVQRKFPRLLEDLDGKLSCWDNNKSNRLSNIFIGMIINFIFQDIVEHWKQECSLKLKSN